MRPFPFLFCFLTLLLIAAACGKSTIDSQITGRWKLVSYTGGPPIPTPLRLGYQVLALRYDHIYEIINKDTVISSGTYHVGHLGNPPKSILYFSTQEDYGSWISFNKDTLVLTYAGIILDLPAVSKYVKM